MIDPHPADVHNPLINHWPGHAGQGAHIMSDQQWGPTPPQQPPPPDATQPAGASRSSQPAPPPEWPAPPASAPKPPRQKRQFLVTKIAIGVAAGIALFLVGVIVLLAVLVGGGSSGDKQAATATPATTAAAVAEQTPPDSTPVDETPTTQPTAGGKVGQVVAISNDDESKTMDLTVTKVSTSTVDRGTIAPNDSSFWDHPSHGLYLIVRIKGKGTAGSFDLNPNDFYVIGADGQHYGDTTYSDTFGQHLESTTVQSGDTLTATMVFDVNTKARHGKVVYSPNFDDTPVATWTF